MRGTRNQCELNSDNQRLATLPERLNMRHDLPDM